MKIHKNQLDYKPTNHIKNVGLISKAILRTANVNRATHSRFDNFHHVLIKTKVRTNVRIRIHTENILSLNNIVQKFISHPLDKRQVGCKFNGVITEEIQIIHNILNISDHTTFPTHISYLFLIIAARVAATSGREVHAAIIVAQMAHSETQRFWAINTAEFTTKSDAITKTHILASNFAKFKIIHSSRSDPLPFFFLNEDIKKKTINVIRNPIQYEDIHRFNQNFQSTVSQVKTQRSREIANKIKKFFAKGVSISFISSHPESFLYQRYQL